MAAAANESKGPQINVLEGGSKELLLERYSDLKFVDDVTDVRCKRCDRVLIYHYVANCGHLFCKNCRRVLTHGEGWRCPQCKEYITTIEEQKLEVEERVYCQMVHCLNHKYGCKQIMPLRQVTKHLEECEDTKERNLPMFYTGTHSMEAVMKRMGEMTEEMKQLREAIDQSQTETENRIFQKLREVMREELLPSQTAMESKLKQVEDNQRRDAERMEQKLVSWNNNILIETTRAQTQTEERCNLKIREMEDKMSQLKQQVDEMRTHLNAVESKVVDRTMELSMEIQRLREDSNQTKDNVSSEMIQLRNHYNKVISELDNKCTSDLGKICEKWREVEVLSNTIDKVRKQVGELDQSLQEKMKAEYGNNIQEMTKIIQESDESKREDLQRKLEQMEQSVLTRWNEDYTQQQRGMEMKLDRRWNVLRKTLAETGIQFDFEAKTTSVVSGQSSSSVKEYNILLIGPSGAGKSLLINSIPNYLKYKNVDDVLNGGDLMCLIPVTFTVVDDSYKPFVYKFGQKSHNENLVGEQLSDDGWRCYELNCQHFKIRFIKSPGIWSTEGPGQNIRYMENLLETISHYDHLHAIAIVLHADMTLMTSDIKDLLNFIFTHLHKTAASNIIFILTHSRSCDYKPLKFLPAFQIYLNELKRSYAMNASIELDRRNFYCVDNAGYRYFITRLNGLRLSNEGPYQYNAWDKSANEIGRFLNRIIRGSADTQPHLVENTVTINEARRLIFIMDNITQDFFSKIREIDQHLQSLIAVRKRLQVNEKKAKLASNKGQHVWVCQSKKCKTSVTMNGVRRVFHAQLCGEGFNSTGIFSQECSVCSCHKSKHTMMPGVCAYREAASHIYDIERVIKDPESDLKNMESEQLFIQSARKSLQNFINSNTIIAERAPDSESIDPEELRPGIVYKMKYQLFNLSYNGARMKAAYDKDVADRKTWFGNINNRTTVVKGVFNLDEWSPIWLSSDNWRPDPSRWGKGDICPVY